MPYNAHKGYTAYYLAKILGQAFWTYQRQFLVEYREKRLSESLEVNGYIPPSTHKACLSLDKDGLTRYLANDLHFACNSSLTPFTCSSSIPRCTFLSSLRRLKSYGISMLSRPVESYGQMTSSSLSGLKKAQ